MALKYQDTKLLVENWRRFGRDELLLTEVARGPDDMSPKMNVVINQSPTGFRILLTAADGYNSITQPVADIKIEKPLARNGLALGAYEVKWVETYRAKWGPMMYDIAMEITTEAGSGIMPDREMVSNEARKIWDYYLNNRPDVEAVQLDDLKNTLTRTKKDNTGQGSSSWAIELDDRGYSKGHKIDWVDSPLSKMYRVRNGTTPTIDKLQKMGKLKDWRGSKRDDVLR